MTRNDIILQRVSARSAPETNDFLSGVIGGVFILGVALAALVIGVGSQGAR